MGKGGTKFDGDQIGHRTGRGPDPARERRRKLAVFLNTGYHPDAEAQADPERGAFDDGATLPQRNARRANVYLSVDKANGDLIGNLVFELFDDIVPVAARIFKLHCTGTGADGVAKHACYRGTPFHNIRPDVFIEGGDVSADPLSVKGKAVAEQGREQKREAAGTGGLTHSAAGVPV